MSKCGTSRLCRLLYKEFFVVVAILDIDNFGLGLSIKFNAGYWIF